MSWVQLMENGEHIKGAAFMFLSGFYGSFPTTQPFPF